VLLCWANPPENAFDNHFEPILMIMKSGSLPAKDACFQCYHPPIFPWISATIGNAALGAGLTMPHVIKLLQFVCCFYGILTVGICYLILKKFPLSDFSRLMSFGVVCFLPRHIYMCAMNSNDTISYLFVAVSIYLAIVALERRLSPASLVALSIALTLTLFTKYTAFAVIPAVLAGFLVAYRYQLIVPRKKILLSLVAALVLPLSVLGGYLISNVKHYRTALPWNVSIYDPSVNRPRDPGGINFVSFKPWEDIKTPMLAPGKLHSFWTLIYSGMWFDTEPYFLSYLDSNRGWWQDYYSWYRGERPFPGPNLFLSRVTTLTAAGLIILGLLPLALVLIGFYLCISGRWKGLFTASPAQRAGLSMFPILLAFNAAGIIALTLRLPIYNMMKPSYLLAATPSLVMFTALGIMLYGKNKFVKRTIFVVFSGLFTLATVHVFHIVLAIRSIVA
jgi:hypothetical protein